MLLNHFMDNFLIEIVVYILVLKEKYENQFRTAFFTGKMKINLLGTWNKPFSWQWTFLGLFQVPLGRMFWLKTWYIHVFSRKSQKCVVFLGEMQEISALEVNINSFQQISVKYLPFPHPDISLMTKYLAEIQVYTWFQYRRR